MSNKFDIATSMDSLLSSPAYQAHFQKTAAKKEEKKEEKKDKKVPEPKTVKKPVKDEKPVKGEKPKKKAMTQYEACIVGLANISEVLDNAGFSNAAALALLSLNSLVKTAAKKKEEKEEKKPGKKDEKAKKDEKIKGKADPKKEEKKVKKASDDCEEECEEVCEEECEEEEAEDDENDAFFGLFGKNKKRNQPVEPVADVTPSGPSGFRSGNAVPVEGDASDWDPLNATLPGGESWDLASADDCEGEDCDDVGFVSDWLKNIEEELESGKYDDDEPDLDEDEFTFTSLLQGLDDKEIDDNVFDIKSVAGKKKSSLQKLAEELRGNYPLSRTAKEDPKVKAKNGPEVIFDSESPKVTDKKDHFPIDTIGKAKNVLSKVNQMDDVPPWYKGSLDSLQKAVRKAVKAKYPSIEVSDKKKEK